MGRELHVLLEHVPVTRKKVPGPQDRSHEVDRLGWHPFQASPVAVSPVCQAWLAGGFFRIGFSDGDELEYRWWQYREVGIYDRAVEIRDDGKRDAAFEVPEDEGILHVPKAGEMLYRLREQ